MSPRRAPRWIKRKYLEALRWMDAHAGASVVALLVVGGIIFAGFQVKNDSDQDAAIAQSTELSRCAKAYVKASNAATKPIREAASQLDAADDRVWHAAQVIFTQKANPADYQTLLRELRARNHLSDELKEARRENPPPEPPETFCAEE